MSEAHDRDFRPALRFRALTPVFDLAVRVARGPEVKRRLLDVLELPPRAEVLDLGSGTGTLAIDLKRRRPDARVTGADADPEIVSIARRKAADAAVDVQFHEADATAMPFADASFDAVVSTLFFHHLDRHASARR